MTVKEELNKLRVQINRGLDYLAKRRVNNKPELLPDVYIASHPNVMKPEVQEIVTSYKGRIQGVDELSGYESRNGTFTVFYEKVLPPEDQTDLQAGSIKASE